jgi:hypothetical protein
MMSEVDLSPTIIAKSDQLNADDLLSGPITVTIVSVTRTSGDDQPITIGIGDGRQPFKPCKTMRRVLVAAWGKDGSKYVGRSMTLYRDPNVKWAGEPVGGIRISAMSDLNKTLEISLSESRKSKKKLTIQPLKASPPSEPHPMKDAFVQMKSRWKEAREQSGDDVSPEAFRDWVFATSQETIAREDAINSGKYTQELIDQLNQALDLNPDTI